MKKLLIVGFAVLMLVACGDLSKVTSVAEPIEETVDNQIKEDIYEELGDKSNNKKDRVVSLDIEKNTGYAKVVLSGDNSLSTKDTKEKQLYDATDVFPIVFKDDSIKKAMVTFQLPLTDKYGKETDEDVLRIVMTRETNDKMEWKNFNIANFDKVADSLYMQQALR